VSGHVPNILGRSPAITPMRDAAVQPAAPSPSAPSKAKKKGLI
jgi:hypothetical protein